MRRLELKSHWKESVCVLLTLVRCSAVAHSCSGAAAAAAAGQLHLRWCTYLVCMCDVSSLEQPRTTLTYFVCFGVSAYLVHPPTGAQSTICVCVAPPTSGLLCDIHAKQNSLIATVRFLLSLKTNHGLKTTWTRPCTMMVLSVMIERWYSVSHRIMVLVKSSAS
jgi:hypothetical protein